MKRIKTASIATLGCKLNQSESDQMARQLSDAGVALVPFGHRADLYLVNSCTVTHVGDRKSRHLIRQAVRANPEAFVAVVGCYAEMEPGAVSAIEGVDAVLGNRGKDRLMESLRDYSLEFGGDPQTGNGAVGAGLLDCPTEEESIPNPDVAAPLRVRVLLGKGEPTPMGARRLKPAATVAEPPSRTRAFVKIQEGCDNSCSYCIVPTARGHQHSRPTGEVVEEIQTLVAEGCQEVVLTGVNITAYGRDHGASPHQESLRGGGLLRLLEMLLAETGVARLRLSSLQPEDWNPAFYDLFSSGRLCRHLHFSLQSGCDAVLRRMKRRYSVDQYARIVAEAREALPGVAITTDVIIGFPGESDAEHQETERFLRSIGFAGLHVFKYSPRSGTPAAEMPGQVNPREKQARSDQLIALSHEMEREFRSRFVGATLGVLWEERLLPSESKRLGLNGSGEDHGFWTGLSDNYVRVYTASPRTLAGTMGGARIERLAGEGVIGALTR